MVKHIVHVNRLKIASNRKHNRREPVVVVKAGGKNIGVGHEVVIRDKRGEIAARLVYRPTEPLPCGAQVWLECYFGTETVTTFPVEPTEETG